MTTDWNHPPPIAICNDKMALLVAPRSGSTSSEYMLGKNIIDLEGYKTTNLKRVVILRDPLDRMRSAKNVEKISKKMEIKVVFEHPDWWIPDFLQQIEDIKQDYILFEKLEQYVSTRKGVSTKDKAEDFTEAEVYSLMNEDIAYDIIKQNNKEVTLEEWHDLCN